MGSPWHHRKHAHEDNPGKRPIIARYPGICAKCRDGFPAGTLVVVTYEHDRCGPAPDAPSVLDGVTR